jgi:hypothetical protein
MSKTNESMSFYNNGLPSYLGVIFAPFEKRKVFTRDRNSENARRLTNFLTKRKVHFVEKNSEVFVMFDRSNFNLLIKIYNYKNTIFEQIRQKRLLYLIFSIVNQRNRIGAYL